jgi:hypothetical protein
LPGARELDYARAKSPQEFVVGLTKTIDASAPAWPTLLGIHLVLGATLIGLSGLHQPAPVAHPPALEARLIAMDVPGALEAVQLAVTEARSERAVMPEQQQMLSRFFEMTAQATGFDVLGVRFQEGQEGFGLQPTDVIIDVEGQAFDIPVFLDAIHRQSARLELVKVHAEVYVGGFTDLQVRIRTHRPVFDDVAWIGERLERAAPGVDRSTPVLERAAELSTWRRFAALEPDLDARSLQRQQAVARLLPPRLVSLRTHGGALGWAPGKGVQIK